MEHINRRICELGCFKELFFILNRVQRKAMSQAVQHWLLQACTDKNELANGKLMHAFCVKFGVNHDEVQGIGGIQLMHVLHDQV